MGTLLIIPFSFDITDILSPVHHALGSAFDFNVKELNCLIDIEYTYNPERNQYHSTMLLRHLLKRFQNDGDKILGITSIDLYVPVLTFVYGEAQLNGLAAIVSSYRLRNEFYGLPESENLLKSRLIKESVHELGHTFGLIHCPYPECVMHSSTYVEEIDLKSSSFCPACKKNFIFERSQKTVLGKVVNE